MTDPDDTAGWKLANLRIPAWLALLFFGPIVAAIVMYYAGGDPWRPSGSVAHGVLLTQPRTLPTGVMILPDGATADFGGKWSLLYVGRGDCDDACKEALFRTRQVRRALDDDRRVR